MLEERGYSFNTYSKIMGVRPYRAYVHEVVFD